MKSSISPYTALLALITSTQACPGSLKSMEINIPKSSSTAKTLSLHAEWTRPWGYQMGRSGPINCGPTTAGHDSQFIYGTLNITGYMDSFRAEPMDHFEVFKAWYSNDSHPYEETVKGMGWHVSRFASAGGKVTSLVLDVLVEGEVIQKEYKEDSFEYHTNAKGYEDGILASIGDNWKTK